MTEYDEYDADMYEDIDNNLDIDDTYDDDEERQYLEEKYKENQNEIITPENENLEIISEKDEMFNHIIYLKNERRAIFRKI